MIRLTDIPDSVKPAFTQVYYHGRPSHRYWIRSKVAPLVAQTLKDIGGGGGVLGIEVWEDSSSGPDCQGKAPLSSRYCQLHRLCLEHH